MPAKSKGYRTAKIIQVTQVQDCDFCKSDGVTRPGLYDSPTIPEAGGRWAFMCDEHMRVYGIFHKGLTTKRRLIRDDD